MKRRNFRFPVSAGSAEALVRWGEKIKYILIAYFLGNIFAKNCRNRTVYVKIVASQRWDVFWDTVYKGVSQEHVDREETSRESEGECLKYYWRINVTDCRLAYLTHGHEWMKITSSQCKIFFLATRKYHFPHCLLFKSSSAKSRNFAYCQNLCSADFRAVIVAVMRFCISVSLLYMQQSTAFHL